MRAFLWEERGSLATLYSPPIGYYLISALSVLKVQSHLLHLNALLTSPIRLPCCRTKSKPVWLPTGEGKEVSPLTVPRPFSSDFPGEAWCFKVWDGMYFKVWDGIFMII